MLAAPRHESDGIEFSSFLPKWFSYQQFITACAILSPGVVAFLVAMMIAWTKMPVPDMHDDFGNLLVAETLLKGRLTNPSPPALDSLQTFHVVLIPTYASKYPIGIGATLAFGKLLTGNYAAGMWLAAALTASSLTWMLLDRFSIKWSWAMGMLSALHPCWQNSWSQEFTHGYLAVAGVALVLGGVVRINRHTIFSRQDTKLSKPQFYDPFAWRHALLIAIGCALVLFSRPFEGGIVCLLLGIAILIPIVRNGWYMQSAFWLAATPGIVVLLSAVGLQAAINRSVTGSFACLPYQLHETQYGVAPVFVWKSPHEPTLGHRFPEQELFHRGWSLTMYHRANSPVEYCQLFANRLQMIQAHWGFVLTFAPMLILGMRRERRSLGWLILVGLVALAVINFVPWVMPHYVAPLIPLAIYLSCEAIRGIRRRIFSVIGNHSNDAPEFHSREFADRSLRTSAHRRWENLIILSLLVAFGISNIPFAYARMHQYDTPDVNWCYRRDDLQRTLESSPEKDLVIVRYESGHSVKREWVFNGADPANAPVVWARWSDAEMNQSLLQGYPGRAIWILDVDSQDNEKLRRVTPESLLDSLD